MKKFLKKLIEATGEMLTAITSNGRTEVLPAEVTETVVMKAYDGDRAMDEALLDMYKKWVSGEVGILNDHEQMYLLLEEKFGVLDE